MVCDASGSPMKVEPGDEATPHVPLKSANNPPRMPGNPNSHLRMYMQIYDAAGCFDPGKHEACGDHRGTSVKKLKSLCLLSAGVLSVASVVTGYSAQAHHAFSMFEF